MRSLFRKIREANRPFCTALVAAAGSSSRMGGTDKLMKFLDNVPVLMRTLTALQRAAAIDEIVIAAREDALVDISTLCKTYGITKCSKVVRGGESRCHSVLLAETGRAVVNIDATLLAQAPKVGPYRQQMAENIAMALHIDPERVNVKATTEEGLGFTGDGSGMAAHAVALIETVK